MLTLAQIDVYKRTLQQHFEQESYFSVTRVISLLYGFEQVTTSADIVFSQ